MLEKEKFFIELTEILELDEKVKGDFNLEECDAWDSLAKISVAAFIESESSIFFDDDEFSNFRTPDDIFTKILEKLMSNEILLTGASSCLGLDFIRKIDEKNLPIHAVVRDLKNFLAEIKKNQYQNIISYEFAHENHEEIQSLMQNIFSKGKPNSLVMFNGTHHIKPLRAENFDSINSMFINNVVIPMLIAKKEFSKIARKRKL